MSLPSTVATQGRGKVLRSGGAKYIFTGGDFCLYHVFLKTFSERSKIWGAQNIWENIAPECPTVATGLLPLGSVLLTSDSCLLQHQITSNFCVTFSHKLNVSITNVKCQSQRSAESFVRMERYINTHESERLMKET